MILQLSFFYPQQTSLQGFDTREQNISLVKEGYSCFQNGDLPGLLNLFTDDIEWTTPNVENALFGGTISGRRLFLAC